MVIPRKAGPGLASAILQLIKAWLLGKDHRGHTQNLVGDELSGHFLSWVAGHTCAVSLHMTLCPNASPVTARLPRTCHPEWEDRRVWKARGARQEVSTLGMALPMGTDLSQDQGIASKPRHQGCLRIPQEAEEKSGSDDVHGSEEVSAQTL